MAESEWKRLAKLAEVNEQKLKRPGERDTGFSKKEIAFLDWIKAYKIKLKGLKELHLACDEAFDNGHIKEKIGRTLLSELLAKYKPK